MTRRVSAILVLVLFAAPVFAWGDPPTPPGWEDGITAKDLGLGNRARGLVFAPDGKSLVTPERATIDAATGKVVPVKEDRAERVLGFDSTGHLLVWRIVRADPTRSPDGIEVIDASADKVVCKVGAGEVNEVAISPDRSLVAVSSADKVGVWDTKTGKQAGALETKAGAIRYYIHAISFSPDGKNLAVASGTGFPANDEINGAVAVWDVATRKLRHVLASTESQVNAIAWSPDSNRLAGGGIHSSALRMWDMATGKETLLRYRGAGQFFDVAFSPDGKTLAANWRDRGSGAVDAGVVFWEVANGRFQGVLSGNREAVRAIAFAPDSRRVATLDTRGNVKVWERPETIAPGDLVRDPKKYEGRIVAVEGALRATPPAVQDAKVIRYAPDLADGLNVACSGKPMVEKGDRVRVVGRFVREDATFTEYTLRATSVTKLPEKP